MWQILWNLFTVDLYEGVAILVATLRTLRALSFSLVGRLVGGSIAWQDKYFDKRRHVSVMCGRTRLSSCVQSAPSVFVRMAILWLDLRNVKYFLLVQHFFLWKASRRIFSRWHLLSCIFLHQASNYLSVRSTSCAVRHFVHVLSERRRRTQKRTPL